MSFPNMHPYFTSFLSVKQESIKSNVFHHRFGHLHGKYANFYNQFETFAHAIAHGEDVWADCEIVRDAFNQQSQEDLNFDPELHRLATKEGDIEYLLYLFTIPNGIFHDLYRVGFIILMSATYDADVLPKDLQYRLAVAAQGLSTFGKSRIPPREWFMALYGDLLSAHSCIVRAYNAIILSLNYNM